MSDILIIVVIDGDMVNWHLKELLDMCKDYNINVYRLDNNRGISYVKNVCIKLLLNQNVDYLYLLDDDIEILNKDLINYVDYVFSRCNIPMITNIHNDVLKNNPEKFIYNDLVLYKTTHNGYFGNIMIINKLYIPIYGYFDILPHKWGYEHILLTKKYLQKTVFNNTSFDLSKYVYNGDDDIIHCHANNNIEYDNSITIRNIHIGSKLIEKYCLNFKIEDNLLTKII